MIDRKWAKKLYDAGQQARANGENLRDAICELGGSWAEMKAFELGYRGQAWDVQEYERFGDVPDGPSQNYADGVQEDGVSVISESWLRTLSAQFISARKGKGRFSGVDTGCRGSDGETLVLPVK